MRKDTHLKKKISEDHVNKLQYQKTKYNLVSNIYALSNGSKIRELDKYLHD